MWKGAWLKAFHERGAIRLLGLDGPWNGQEQMIDPAIEFSPVDLRGPVPVPVQDRFDLAISLEVAEHLEPEHASAFVDRLAGLSDVIMFGAAYSAQGGVNHLNEQPHTFWQRLFSEHSYVVYDMFRRHFWGDSEIEFWYAQNTFLYVRQGSKAEEVIAAHHGPKLVDVGFMNAVHPTLYEAKLREIQTLYGQLAHERRHRQAIKRLLPQSLVAAIQRMRSTA